MSCVHKGTLIFYAIIGVFVTQGHGNVIDNQVSPNIGPYQGGGACPEEWYEYKPTKECFRHVDVQKTWDEARDDCKKMGADLAYINDNYTAIALTNYVYVLADFWIGLQVRGNRARTNAASWLDQTRRQFEENLGYPLNSTIFYAGVSNNEDACVGMWISFNIHMFFANPCTKKLTYVCHKGPTWNDYIVLKCIGNNINHEFKHPKLAMNKDGSASVFVERVDNGLIGVEEFKNVTDPCIPWTDYEIKIPLGEVATNLIEVKNTISPSTSWSNMYNQ